MDQPTATVIGATVAAAVAVCGWHVSHQLGMQRENRTRRLEAVLKHTQRQIDEFYGPLVNLIEQVFNTWRVRENILFPSGRPGHMEEGGIRKEAIPAFFQEAYFFPLHERIREILMTKLHLLEGNRVPPSFKQYLEHSTQQLIQHRLWKEMKVPTDHVKGVSWPNDFYGDVRGTMDALMKRYDDCLGDLYSKGVYSIAGSHGRPNKSLE